MAKNKGGAIIMNVQKGENVLEVNDDFINIKKILIKERRRNLLRKFISNKLLIFGSIIIIFFTFIAIFANFIAPYDPLEINVINRYQSPNAAHWFGTDEYGRDILSRVIHGCQISMMVAFFVAIS